MGKSRPPETDTFRISDYLGHATERELALSPHAPRRNGENMGVRSDHDLEVRASSFLREAISKAVASVEEPELRRVVSEIASEINGKLYLLSLTAREHD